MSWTPRQRRALWGIIACSLVFDAVCLALTRPKEASGSDLLSQQPAVSTSRSAGESPLFVADAPEYDFGTVRQGAVLQHRFRFRNGGQEPLTVLGLEESCGCTSSLLSKEFLKADESGEIEVSFSSGTLEGPIKKTITVSTDDPDSPAKLTIRATVQPLFRVDPGRLSFGDVRLGQESRQRVVVLPAAPDIPLNVSRVWSRNPDVTVEDIRRLDSPKGAASFEVVFRAAKLDEGIDGVVFIETGHPEVPRNWVHFSAQVVP
jgi:Protein of unknown function (DUF1573)